MSNTESDNRDSGNTAEETAEAIEKPGALLKAARERAGISVDEMAKALYLTRSKLRFLEADDYDNLQSQVFIKGYLRKYAPMVGLDGEKLVELFQTLHDQMHADDDELNEGDVPNTLVPKFVVPAALFGLAALGLVTIFVFSGGNDNHAVAVTPASVVDAGLVEQVAANASDNVRTQSNNLDRELAVEARELSTVGPEDTSANRNQGPAISTTTPATLTTGPDTKPQFGDDSPEPKFNDSPELRFAFSEDCWVEVRDNDDTILYSDIAKAGESFELQGEPPFSISMGNAEAVTLYWGETMIKTQPRSGYKTAKITVGEPTVTR
jgi:cytoskeleton protein RodZ